MESTSSSKKIFYDVFINHRGPDVKLKVASPIYQMLDQVGVRSFFDKDELKMGDFLTEKIKGAIQSASVHIAIFSPRYAESSWCLDELLWMLDTKVLIIPVFYNVQPSELRHFDKGKGESEYARAFARHEGRYDSEKINRWKEALGRAADISGAIVGDDNW